MRALLRHSGIVDHQHRIATTDEPVRLNEQLRPQWHGIPDASRDEMMQLIIVARCKPFCHGLNTLTITRPDQPSHIKRTHPPPRLVTQAIQERFEPASKIVFPI
jgi:hypothetical protein